MSIYVSVHKILLYCSFWDSDKSFLYVQECFMLRIRSCTLYLQYNGNFPIFKTLYPKFFDISLVICSRPVTFFPFSAFLLPFLLHRSCSSFFSYFFIPFRLRSCRSLRCLTVFQIKYIFQYSIVSSSFLISAPSAVIICLTPCCLLFYVRRFFTTL